MITTIAGGGPNNLPALAANLTSPTGVAVDADGNFFIASGLQSRVFKVDSMGQLTVFAGDGTQIVLTSFEDIASSAEIGDGAPAVTAKLAGPLGIALDGAGNLFITSSTDHRVRRVDAATGFISTVAGTGVEGYSGDGGPAATARLRFPHSVAVDRLGNLFIADSEDHRVRRVDATTGIITTVAGSGAPAYCLCCGEGLPATSVRLSAPSGVVVDDAGNLFIADRDNRCVRRVDAVTGIATAATRTFLIPVAVALDRSGSLLVADATEERIWRVDSVTGITTVFAGRSPEFSDSSLGDGGPATSAGFSNLSAITLDATGNVFIADGGFSRRVRRVDAVNGIITTVAGNGTRGFGGDGGTATNASFAVALNPQLTVDGAGDVLIADGGDNDRIRHLDLAAGIITTIAGNGDQFSTGDGSLATNAGLADPSDVVLDDEGNLLIAERDSNRIRRVGASTGVITTAAAIGFSCGRIAALTVDADGNFYVACQSGSMPSQAGSIQRVDAITGAVTRFAGGGTALGDGGPATSALLRLPSDVVLDSVGNLLIADTWNNRVRRVDPATGIITTVAGGGISGVLGDGGPASSAALESPFGLALDSAGNLFIGGGARVRRIDAATGIITTVAGNGNAGFSGDGGSASEAQLSSRVWIAVGAQGDLFIRDGLRVRRVGEESASVAIDIKPDSNPNSINPEDQGVIPVAILGSDRFDVTEIDGSSLRFAGGEAAPAHDWVDPMVFADHLEDVNGDGISDLMSHYRTEESGIAYGDMTACLSGATLDGTSFKGCDSVRTVPDMDGDQLLDVDEDAAGSNAFFRDSDNDGYDDGTEVLTMGTNPLDALDPAPAPVEQKKPSRLRNRRR